MPQAGLRVLSSFLLPLLAVLSLFAAASVHAMDIDDPFPDPERQALYERLMSEVRCLVCQNQTIGDSNAPLAADLRREIRGLVEAGRTEPEIQTFLLDRYGDFVLYRPRLTASTALLWFAPAILLIIGGFALWRIVKRRSQLPVPADEEENPSPPV